ncbi:hypothetical protein KEM60_02736 [Austwickia sp. TVS 96-490-7B]|uniref:hypothetical protein n=1 Tax=Austwickia sp. TVS 96-490-7B TaxID=2830843 RepID=UPI001C5647F1|nr:hypothetical protein [Austwickia sp. TVS 96-490-7B]MBW3086515.1 hypothetical protein [Austwickia sp. TVS 96-490-7B]
MASGFHLGAGQVGPTQQSSVSCGAACLAVARMLREPQIAEWVCAGSPYDRRTALERFGELERALMRRTNGVFSPTGTAQLPWPREWGTSPWGAKAGMERWGADPGTRYRVLPARQMSAAALGELFDRTVARSRPGAPVLVYVGNDLAPRHVCLAFADRDGRDVLWYEPSSGQVEVPSREAFLTSRLDLGGWDRPWLVVAPTAQQSRIAQQARRWMSLPVPSARPILLRQRYSSKQ